MHFNQYCMTPYSSKNLTDDKILFNCRLPRKGRATENMFGIRTNRFKVFANRGTLTQCKVSFIVMATLAFHNLLGLKPRDSYTPKGSVDEIQTNELLLQDEWCENYSSNKTTNLNRVAT